MSQPIPESNPPEAVAAEAESSLAGLLSAQIGEVEAETRCLAALMKHLRPLLRAAEAGELERLSNQAQALEAELPELGHAAERARRLLLATRQGLEQERTALRDRLAKELRALCEARGLTMRVVSREEPVEVRIPPFAVIIDRQRGQAELRFARLPLYGCSAKAEDILATRERALTDLNLGLEPREFFLACQRAWLAARASAGSQAVERIEIAQFLPYLALQMQSKAFGIDPTAENYRTYSRVRFAWDVLRLQRAGLMSLGGWRLNLGVATGTTASTKNRAIFLENEEGEGEYKLTLFFTPTAETT